MSLQDSGQYYHEVLKRIPPRDLPASRTRPCRSACGGGGGACTTTSVPIRTVLVHRPGDEIRIMTADRYDTSIEALIDDEAQWYWRGDRAPDLAVMQKEHDALVDALSREGAEVVHVGGSPTDPKAMFTRDNGVIVPGGAIICRMGPVGARPGMGRRGEEAHVSRRDRRARDADPPHHPRQRALRGRELRAAERHDGGGRAVVPPERGGGAPDRGGARGARHPPPPGAAGRTRAAHRRPARHGGRGPRPDQHRADAVLVPRHASRPQDPLGRGAPRRQPARPELPRRAARARCSSPSTTATAPPSASSITASRWCRFSTRSASGTAAASTARRCRWCGIAPERGTVADGRGADRRRSRRQPLHAARPRNPSRFHRAVGARRRGRERRPPARHRPRRRLRAGATRAAARAGRLGRRRRGPLGGEPAAGAVPAHRDRRRPFLADLRLDGDTAPVAALPALPRRRVHGSHRAGAARRQRWAPPHA
jgi:hypothetical protein